MATYSAIAGSELAVNKPLTSSLMTRLNDNPIALLEQIGWGVTATVTVSAEQTITNGGTVTFNHNLASISTPTDVDIHCYLKCTSAEGGYSTNDIIAFSPSGQGTSQSTGMSLRVTTTQIIVRYGSFGLSVTRADTGAAFTITAANWKLIVKSRG